MAFLVVFAGSWIGAILLRRPLHRYPWVFYGLALILDLACLFGASLGLPRVLWRLLFELQCEALLPLAIFTVVMFLGCFRRESWASRTLMPVRGELSILACLLSFGHVATYVQAYGPRVLGSSAVPPAVMGGFVLAVVVLVLLLVLGVTSLKAVRRVMAARAWKGVQRLAYLFFALVFVHALFMLVPSAINGGAAAQASVVVYVSILGLYAALRLGRFVVDRRESQWCAEGGEPDALRIGGSCAVDKGSAPA